MTEAKLEVALDNAMEQLDEAVKKSRSLLIREFTKTAQYDGAMEAFTFLIGKVNSLDLIKAKEEFFAAGPGAAYQLSASDQ